MQDLHLRLDIDGKTVQEGHTADMLYTVDELIEIGKEKHLDGVLSFFIDNSIDYDCIVI